MEDQFGSESPYKGLKRPSVMHFKKGSKKGSAAAQGQPEDNGDWRQLGKMPCEGDDYPTWLQFQKRKWKLQRLERKRRQVAGLSGVSMRAAGNNITSYLARQKHSLAHQHWEIIQITMTDNPGWLRVWALVNGDLHSLSMQVYRQFYVNRHSPGTKI